MTISDRINKKFNSHGVTIEESIKNANVGGGGSSNVMIINRIGPALNKTWQEIHDAMENLKICIIYQDIGDGALYMNMVAGIDKDDVCNVYTVNGDTYHCDTANDYPTYAL